MKPYPTVTIAQDRMGNLHVFKGKRSITQATGFLFQDSKGRESDVFFQLQSDIEEVLNNLPVRTKNAIEAGYIVRTNFLNDEYFPAGCGYRQTY